MVMKRSLCAAFVHDVVGSTILCRKSLLYLRLVRFDGLIRIELGLTCGFLGRQLHWRFILTFKLVFID